MSGKHRYDRETSTRVQFKARVHHVGARHSWSVIKTACTISRRECAFELGSGQTIRLNDQTEKYNETVTKRLADTLQVTRPDRSLSEAHSETGDYVAIMTGASDDGGSTDVGCTKKDAGLPPIGLTDRLDNPSYEAEICAWMGCFLRIDQRVRTGTDIRMDATFHDDRTL